MGAGGCTGAARRLGRRRSGHRDGDGRGRRRRAAGGAAGSGSTGSEASTATSSLRHREPHAVEPADEPLDLELVDGDVGLEAERHRAGLADEIAEIGPAGRARDREPEAVLGRNGAMDEVDLPGEQRGRAHEAAEERARAA